MRGSGKERGREKKGRKGKKEGREGEKERRKRRKESIAIKIFKMLW